MFPIDKLFLLAIAAGMYVGLAGIFALTVSQGLPNADAGIKKLLLGLTFAVALVLIIIVGGELFTGNTMYMISGVLTKKISLKGLMYSWTLSYFGNLVGCLLVAFFLGYLTELFDAEPWKTNIKALAVHKCELSAHVVFLRGVGANWLVCLAVFLSVSAEDISGKILGCMYPVAAFAASGFEHSIANMFYIPMGMMLGADVSVGDFIGKNLILATLGNIVGGGILVGASSWYFYHGGEFIPPENRHQHFWFSCCPTWHEGCLPSWGETEEMKNFELEEKKAAAAAAAASAPKNPFQKVADSTNSSVNKTLV